MTRLEYELFREGEGKDLRLPHYYMLRGAERERLERIPDGAELRARRLSAVLSWENPSLNMRDPYFAS